MFELENTYRLLSQEFWSDVTPSAAISPRLMMLNRPLADELGVDLSGLDDDAIAALMSGKSIPRGAKPIAMNYAGHQFGGFNSQLGDGRAILLGEVINAEGVRLDLHLKGAGPTPYSRRGDGLNWYGPALREYIVSEAMHRLGVPTTRALAVVATGGRVRREQDYPGAIVVRVAESHIRVGTFEWFAARRLVDQVRELADYAIGRHDPQLAGSPDRYLEFFRNVAHRQMKLVARWKSLGFIHGVMNTDNCAVSGETIDYGPAAFMDTFSFDKVFSSIDRQGRYRYGQQENLAIWNLTNLANCLVPIVSDDHDEAATALTDVIRGLVDVYDAEWLRLTAPKLGIGEARPEDADLVNDWLQHMQDERLDFTIAFRKLASDVTLPDDDEPGIVSRIRTRVATSGTGPEEAMALMNAHNPLRIPRNHQVERAIQAALSGDMSVARELHAACREPFVDDERFADYALPPTDDEVVAKTFCGT